MESRTRSVLDPVSVYGGFFRDYGVEAWPEAVSCYVRLAGRRWMGAYSVRYGSNTPISRRNQLCRVASASPD